jgi:hypothetical protein
MNGTLWKRSPQTSAIFVCASGCSRNKMSTQVFSQKTHLSCRRLWQYPFLRVWLSVAGVVRCVDERLVIVADTFADPWEAFLCFGNNRLQQIRDALNRSATCTFGRLLIPKQIGKQTTEDDADAAQMMH